MNKQEFLDILSRSLYGKIDENILKEHIQYYESYISSGIANGKTEQEVLEELGDPRLIAKTILDASKQKSSAEEGFFHEDNKTKKKATLERWKAKLIVLISLLVILFICIFVFRIILMVLPFILVMAGILWIIKTIRN